VNATRWDLNDVALAHFAITDVAGKKFRYYEKLNRMSPYTANAREGSLAVFNEGWSVSTAADGSFLLKAAAGGDAIDLRLSSSKPPAIHGLDGISVKAAGTTSASHYYSLTRLAANGTIRVDGRAERCGGLAWMDHEFGSSYLREDQQGWDWFSLQLDNDTELMVYRIRRADGTQESASSGSLVSSDGSVIHLRAQDFSLSSGAKWKSPRSGAVYPQRWTIRVAPFDLTLKLQERLPDQELVTQKSTRVTYWEGLVDASGTFGETAVKGSGYVEMTGYAPRGGRSR
jgi:predicted secreted hydrolase